MITLDRDAGTPVHDQLVEQLRFHIASGHFKVGDDLPSTRQMGKQVGASFHTVRKAYQTLEREGLLEAQVGRGFRVKDVAPLPKGERMERGAAVVQEALQRLVGLGLPPAEIEHLFEEQLQGLALDAAGPKLVAAARARELAEAFAEQLGGVLQRDVVAATLEELHRHPDADFAFTPFADVRRVMEALPRADVRGVGTVLPPKALDRVARLLETETLGLVTRRPDAIAPLMQDVRAATGFAGQVLAASLESTTDHLRQLIRQTDLVLFTPPCRRRLRPLLHDSPRHAEVCPLVDPGSVELVRRAVPA